MLALFTTEIKIRHMFLEPTDIFQSAIIHNNVTKNNRRQKFTLQTTETCHSTTSVLLQLVLQRDLHPWCFKFIKVPLRWQAHNKAYSLTLTILVHLSTTRAWMSFHQQSYNNLYNRKYQLKHYQWVVKVCLWIKSLRIIWVSNSSVSRCSARSEK